MRGAPRPAGRISNSRCGAFALTLPMRPSVVPPRMRAPLTSGLDTKSFGFRPSGALSEGSSAVWRWTWASPPAARAFLRVGLANRRTLATGAGLVVSLAAGALASAVDSWSVLASPARLGEVSFFSVLAERFLGDG